MIKIDLKEKFKELYDYIDVDVDKQFAIELIPVVELVMTSPDIIKKLAKHEPNFIQRLYINYCEKNNVKSDTYTHLIECIYNFTRMKVYRLLETLYDIVEEDSPSWRTKWKIKPYHKIKYNEVESNIAGIKAKVLEPKPEYAEKVKKNKKITKYNDKQYKKCKKWRDSNLKFYKKILKIVNN